MAAFILGAANILGYWILVSLFGVLEVTLAATVISTLLVAFLGNAQAFKVGHA